MSGDAPPDNAESLDLLAVHSDCRDQTAQAIASLWGPGDGDHSVLDFGAGDGGLLADVLQITGRRPAVAVVEPDVAAAARACLRLNELGARAHVVDDVASGIQFDLCLAAHVLYYVEDLSGWMSSMTSGLSPDGAVTTVLTEPSCDMYALRGIVRRFQRRAPRVSLEEVVDQANRHGLSSRVVPIASTFEYVSADPFLTAVPAESSDQRFARFICWLTRLDATSALDKELRGNINDFIAEHHDGERCTFRLRDVAAHSTRE